MWLESVAILRVPVVCRWLFCTSLKDQHVANVFAALELIMQQFIPDFALIC